MILTIAIVTLLFAADKAISYYGVTLGLLTYITRVTGTQLTAEEVKQFRNAALARRVRELLGKR